MRDLRSINDQAKGDPAQIELLGVARMVNVIPEDLDEMDAADYQKVKERFLEIMGVADKPVVWAGAAGPVVPVSAELERLSVDDFCRWVNKPASRSGARTANR